MKIPKTHRLVLYLGLSALFASGLVWWLLGFAITPETASDSILFIFRSLNLKIHGASAMISLIILGALIPNHIVKSWKTRRNKPSGAILVSVLVLLVLTGYFLYYGDEIRNISSMIHITLGLLLPFFLIGHILKSRLYKRRHHSDRSHVRIKTTS